jgi:streptogramin lyase
VPISSGAYQHGPRPTAWEGTVEGGCALPNPRLWMGWYKFAQNTGVFHRLNGSTGAIEDTVEVPGLSGLNYGPYGGAVNKQGDFWVSCWQVGPLVHIDGDTLAAEVIPMPAPPADQQWAYGMALDQYGNPWIASGGAAAVYDVASGQWQFISTGNGSTRGVMVDKEDRAWFAVDDANSCGLAVVDVAARTLLAGNVPLNGCAVPVGVSIDVEGYVWVVDQGNYLAPAPGWAYKVDPDSYAIELQVPGLFGPYTYSDMTGAGLNLVVNPPAG